MRLLQKHGLSSQRFLRRFTFSVFRLKPQFESALIVKFVETKCVQNRACAFVRRRIGYRAYPGRLLPFYFQRVKRNIYCFSAYFNLIAIGLNSKNFPVVKNWLILPCVWVNMSTSVLCVCLCMSLCMYVCVYVFVCDCVRPHARSL